MQAAGTLHVSPSGSLQAPLPSHAAGGVHAGSGVPALTGVHMPPPAAHAVHVPHGVTQHTLPDPPASGSQSLLSHSEAWVHAVPFGDNPASTGEPPTPPLLLLLVLLPLLAAMVLELDDVEEEAPPMPAMPLELVVLEELPLELLAEMLVAPPVLG
jgi:hypothetical protein